MKRITLILLALFIGLTTMAQEKDKEDREMRTLFGSSGIRSNGAYGAVTTAYTKMDGRDAIMVGGRGAWVINHSIGIGLAGYGFMTEHKADTELNDDYQLLGGYGGLMFEFIVNPNSPVHLSFPMTIGAGGVTYSQRDSFRRNNDFDRLSEDTQAFFVVEPGVELEMNVVRFMRLAVGVSYRYTSDVDLTYTGTSQRIMDKDVLHGLSGGITLKFGKF